MTSAPQFSPDLFSNLHWRNIGPFRGGRTRAAAGVPSHPNLFYAGQVNGGVWKSDDYGRTWTPIFDSEPTQSIGAIAVAPNDPNVIYVASGEGLQRPDLSVGDGIYKSEDAGKTWNHLGLRDGQQIPALVIDPRNSNRLFAAVLGHPYGPNEERGIFRSDDAGVTWKKVLYVDENTGASDVVIDASNPDVIYASLWEARQGPWEFDNGYAGGHGGLFKSEDGGKTWRRLTNGLPQDLVQIYIAIARSSPNRLYAAAASSRDVMLYRSDDAGESWYRATTDPRPALRIGGGDLPVPKVDPKNADIVYSASIVTWRSMDGGKTWTGIKGAPGGDDYQNIWINPNDPDIVLLVSDQGAAVSANGGRTWSSWYNQPTAQFYHVSATNSFPYRVCGGQQESGSVCISSRGNDGAITFREWHPVGVIEYGYVAPDPLDPDLIYGAGRGQVSKFHWSTGQVEMVAPAVFSDGSNRADRTQPILFSPIDPHLLYYASNVLRKTNDGAHSWQIISPDLSRPDPAVPASLGTMAAKDPKAGKQKGVIYSVAPSFKNLNTIWAGTDDGLIWITRDAGKKWNDITPPGLTSWSKVTQLEASHFDDYEAYASVSRFRVNDLGAYVYRTRDGGKTWTRITEGLPDSPINTVREDPIRRGLLFAGSETAVWISFDDGDHWQSLQLNLPHTSMRDLAIHGDDLIVATHGRSFWVLDDIAPLRQMSESATQSDAWLFHPALAYRVRRDTNTDTPLPPDEPFGENPPDGAIVDYLLKKPEPGAVALDILDSSGKLVRHYASTDETQRAEANPAKLGIPPFWVRGPKVLQAGSGIHRFVWDLHYESPESLRHEYPIAAVPHRTPRLPLGPRALPGTYTAKLTALGRSYATSITLRSDPRVKTAPIGLQRQFAMQQQLSGIITGTTKAVRQARSVQEQLGQIQQSANRSVAEPLAALLQEVNKELGTATESSTLLGINGRASALYADINSADADPTMAQTTAEAQLQQDFPTAIQRWHTLTGKEFPALNQQLRTANLPEIRLDEKPSAEEGDDESNQDEDIG